MYVDHVHQPGRHRRERHEGAVVSVDVGERSKPSCFTSKMVILLGPSPLDL
jgi:hypothetical protein